MHAMCDWYSQCACNFKTDLEIGIQIVYNDSSINDIWMICLVKYNTF